MSGAIVLRRASFIDVAFVALVLVFSGCVPADDALSLGSAQFTVSARGSPRDLPSSIVADRWEIELERFVVSFKTMTIVDLQDSEQCAYRGRGATSNAVFEGLEGTLVQAFNGIRPGACPDVGMRLGPPDDNTVLGEGATLDDMKRLLAGDPAHALLYAKASLPRLDPDAEPRIVRVELRFDTARTSSSFGGCRDAVRGVRIRPQARYGVLVSFAPDALFRDAINSTSVVHRFEPFALADELGDDDGIVTMAELDGLSLSQARRATFGGPYLMPSGTAGTFGDFVRLQFQTMLTYGMSGACNGITPGTSDEANE